MTKNNKTSSIDEILNHQRLRRLRQNDWTRNLVRENEISCNDLIWPIFIIEGKNHEEDVASMPDVKRYSIDRAVDQAKLAHDLGIPVIALFPYTDPQLRDEMGSEALNENNLVCRACRAISKAVPQINILCDVALDPYTSHGHDGLLEGDVILNDATIEVLIKQAILQAQNGSTIIGPSDMMDGRVGAIRRGMDAVGLQDKQIMSYSAKYASAFYGPFRDAIGSNAALKGDKRTYQMDPANTNEALREAQMDILEGADMIMVKPGMPYLDIVYRLKSEFQMPTFAYQVSGEYAMIMAAHQNGWLDGERAMLESIMAFKRAGADGVLSYFAPKVAKILKA